MATEKEHVKGVFDRLAAEKSWETLYSGKLDRTTYNFVTRQRAVESLIEPFAGGNILDLGCGTGNLVPFYAERCTHYTGLDLSPQMIERARQNHSREVSRGKVEFMVGDCEGLPFQDGTFDLVSAVALIEYLPNPSRVLNEITRVLRKGGVALLTVPHRSCIHFKIRDVLTPLRNALFPIYLKLKGGPMSVMHNVKHYLYDPEQLDPLLRERGLEKMESRFTNYYLIPYPLDHLIPQTYMRLSDIAERSSRNGALKPFAANYIALYRKN